MSQVEFSPEEYVNLVNSFLLEGYSIVDFKSVSPDERNLILRHDIDFCLQRAARMAKLEQGIGVISTYFVLLSSNFYNVFSAQSQKFLREILACGHNVGLHFDPLAHKDLEKGMKMEVHALESLIYDDISIVSFHRPHEEWLNSTQRICGIPHTYEPQFFSEIAYVSDARGGWHYGHPFGHQAVSEAHALQLVTHPVWWMQDEGERFTPTSVLTIFADEKNTDLQKNMADNCKSYQLPKLT